MNIASKSIRYLNQIHLNPKFPQNPNHLFKIKPILPSNFSSTSYRKRVNRRNSAASKPTLNEPQFNKEISHLLPRFTPQDLCNLITQQQDPLICLHLFNYASNQPRFTHDTTTFHVTIKKLGAAKMYPEMDRIVESVLSKSVSVSVSDQSFGSEVLYNSIIYFYTEGRMLSKAVSVYKHMRSLKQMECRPSIRTYNLLFAAFLSRRSNSYINYVYMGTMRMLFKNMVDDGVEPDVFALNSMIKGYVLSLHVNDALRVYHQMGVVYDCRPNSFTFDYLIHGLCAQGRTCNAMKICGEMKEKGFVPSGKSYNSVVCAFALEGEVDRAVGWLWEMVENGRLVDYITCWTVVDECCKRDRCGDAVRLIEELQEKRVVDRRGYKKLRYELKVNYGELCDRNGMKNGSSNRIE
ncbi:putative tetratricopeptide-like helical domain superfamily [Helianthus anomalus]